MAGWSRLENKKAGPFFHISNDVTIMVVSKVIVTKGGVKTIVQSFKVVKIQKSWRIFQYSESSEVDMSQVQWL